VVEVADTVELSSPPVEVPPPPPAAFDVGSLPADQQELHRRANRAAKVSMQDIKLLKPKDVQLGRENKDICTRLKDDIEKARKEYDRRFKTILEQPVDYFYQWMVDILADGNADALGEYPYPSPVLRR
jgi:nucleoside-diphosphate-sugar epimerase